MKKETIRHDVYSVGTIDIHVVYNGFAYCDIYVSDYLHAMQYKCTVHTYEVTDDFIYNAYENGTLSLDR